MFVFCLGCCVDLLTRSKVQDGMSFHGGLGLDKDGAWRFKGSVSRFDSVDCGGGYML